MAKLYGLSGKITGKKGDNVFAVRNGEQIIRQYNPVVNNPQSPAQTEARAKMKLMSQLASIYAPIIAMHRQGAKSPRNLFVKKNYGLCDYYDGKAELLVQYLQLTDGFRFLPHFTVDRTSHDSCVCMLESDGRAFLSAVMYAMVSVDANGKIRVVDSIMVENSGADGFFEGEMKYDANAIAVYAYGVSNLDNAAETVRFANISGNAAEYVAELLAHRSATIASATFTSTRGCYLPVDTDTMSSSEESGVLVRVQAPAQITVSGGGRYAVGAQVFLSADVPSGWTIDGWYINNERVSTYGAYSFIASENVLVEFRAIAPTTAVLTVEATPPQMGSCTGGGTYSLGAYATLVATPNAGYRFVGWYRGFVSVSDKGQLLSTEANYSHLVDRVETITGVFENQPAGTANVAANRSSSSVAAATSVSGIGNVTLNSNTTVVCNYDTSLYDFVGWFANDGVSDPAQALSVSAGYTFMVTGDTTLYYVLKNKASGNIAVTIGQSIGYAPNSVTTTGAGNYAVGDSVTVTAQSSDMYAVFAGWYSDPDGEQAHFVYGSASYTFTAAESITLYPKFGSSSD